MYDFSQQTAEVIQRVTGISQEEMINLDVEEIDRRIQTKIGKSLNFPKKRDPRFPGRGSVYIALSRFIFRSKIDREFSKI